MDSRKENILGFRSLQICKSNEELVARYNKRNIRNELKSYLSNFTHKETAGSKYQFE